MYKFVTLFALVACAVAAPAPGALFAAPAAYHVAAEPVAVAHSLPLATSYANTYKVDKSAYYAQPALAYHTAPVAVAHAPVAVAHAPVVHQAQAYSVHPASYSYAHAAPVAAYYH